MKRLLNTLVLLAVFTSLPAAAQQSQEFGDYVVHYNALSSSLISQEVAKAYSIRRSDSRALINISVLKSADDQTTTAVSAEVTVSGRNLTGQVRQVDMREINDGDGAIYYIGELSVRNMESFNFTAVVIPEGQNKPLTLKFRQQFYTE